MIKISLVAALLAAMAVAQEAPPANEPAPPAKPATTQDNAAQARKIIDSAIQALGGQAYLNIKDVTTEGRTYSFHLGRPTSVGVVYYGFYRYPDKERVELTKKRDVAYVFSGGKGWEITYKGAKLQESKEVADYNRRRKFALDVILREWMKQPGIALFYEGSSIAEQKPVDQVTIMNAQNEAVTLDFDSNTHLPIKKSYTWRDPSDKERNTEAEGYDAYRAVDGVMTPFTVTRYYNGDISNQKFINSIRYNESFPDSLFSPDTPADTKTK